jgi:hypothetical protein
VTNETAAKVGGAVRQKVRPRIAPGPAARRGTSARTAPRLPRRSGANPNDQQRHRKAGAQGAANRQRECCKQIFVGLDLTPGHTVTPPSPHGHQPVAQG